MERERERERKEEGCYLFLLLHYDDTLHSIAEMLVIVTADVGAGSMEEEQASASSAPSPLLLLLLLQLSTASRVSAANSPHLREFVSEKGRV